MVRVSKTVGSDVSTTLTIASFFWRDRWLSCVRTSAPTRSNERSVGGNQVFEHQYCK